MVINRWNGRSDIVIFLTQASVIFIQENAAFIYINLLRLSAKLKEVLKKLSKKTTLSWKHILIMFSFRLNDLFTMSVHFKFCAR